MTDECISEVPGGVDVLLSTYNGSSYVREMLDSLLQQSFQGFDLLVRDDCSTDNTLSILNEYRSRFNGRLRVIDDSRGNLGPAQSFKALLNETEADYVLFADQDDVWLPEKVQVLVAEMIEEEKRSPGIPVLVHSDLEVVDENMHSISSSFWGYQGLKPDRTGLSNIMIQNIVTGCATVVNRALVEMMKDMPEEATMHDWWAAMVASTFGVIGTVSVPLIRYRQHGANTLGAKRYGPGYVIKRGISVFSSQRLSEFRSSISLSQKQAEAFLDRYSSELSSEQTSLLEGFVSLGSKGWIERRLYLLRNGVLKHGISRNIGLMMSV
ncbi:MAG: glycosyltransferase family 2 protein [Pseudomonadota bacterium]